MFSQKPGNPDIPALPQQLLSRTAEAILLRLCLGGPENPYQVGSQLDISHGTLYPTVRTLHNSGLITFGDWNSDGHSPAHRNMQPTELAADYLDLHAFRFARIVRNARRERPIL